MNPDLKEALSSETTERLFYYFKHDGSIDFDKKLVAGQILQERGYYKDKLVEEKAKIAEAIQSVIDQCCDPEKVKAQRRKELKNGVLWSILPWVIYLFGKLVDFLFDDKWGRSDKPMLLVFFAVFLVILGYRVTIYRKNLKRFIQSRTADKETSEKRLRMIEAEWPF